MKNTAGAALIAREIEADFMKIAMKPSAKLQVTTEKQHVCYLREADAVILTQLPDEELSRISQHTALYNIGLSAGERVSGKRVLLCSDTKIPKAHVGVPEAVSGRHKRQYLRVKAKAKCFAFVVTTWGKDNIEPPEPMQYLGMLYTLTD